MVRGLKMGSVIDDGTPGGWRCPSIDFAVLLTSLVKSGDFVVVKIDVEGGEWTLLDHLYATGAMGLIDEIFIECHTRMAPALPRGRKRVLSQDCVDMVNGLRGEGVYAHQWL